MWLTLRTGDDRGRSVLVEGEHFVAGRDDDCDLVLRDARVSRRHAALKTLADGRAMLQDLGSSNGTFVNGARVETALLRGQEQLQFGDTVLVSSLEEPSQRHGSTILGSAVPGGGPRRESASAVHRMLVERSLRRSTILAAAAVAIATGFGALFATNVLSPGGDSAATAVERVVRLAAPATVLVESRRQGVRAGTGTGWVLDAGEGLIVTNAHVVNAGSSFRIGIGGTLRPARLVGVAPCEDLAVLRASNRTGLRSLPLADQSSLRLGETVVAVGYPANASAEASLTPTTGVVSVVRTAYREPALDIPRFSNVVQTDAAINPGNSGGPLLDLNGRLIGVTAAGRTTAPDGRTIQGQNYAIGVDRVKEIVRVLRSGRSIGWSGVSFEYPSPNQLRADDLRPGLVAAAAVPGTGADRAGLGRGRATIVAVDGIGLDNSLASYCDAIDGVRSGDRVSFSVVEPGASAPRDIEVRME
jgi:S1-C subfamily serine protease